MSGLGYSLDTEAMRAKQSGRLLELAYDRGFRWLASLNYAPSEREGIDLRDSLRETFWLADQNVDAWTFRRAYVEPESGCTFIEFTPRDVP